MSVSDASRQAEIDLTRENIRFVIYILLGVDTTADRQVVQAGWSDEYTEARVMFCETL